MPYSLVNMQIVTKQVRNVRKLQRVWVHTAVVITVIIGQEIRKWFLKMVMYQTISKDGPENVSQSTNAPVKLLVKRIPMKITEKEKFRASYVRNNVGLNRKSLMRIFDI